MISASFSPGKAEGGSPFPRRAANQLSGSGGALARSMRHAGSDLALARPQISLIDGFLAGRLRGTGAKPPTIAGFDGPAQSSTCCFCRDGPPVKRVDRCVDRNFRTSRLIVAPVFMASQETALVSARLFQVIATKRRSEGLELSTKTAQNRLDRMTENAVCGRRCRPKCARSQCPDAFPATRPPPISV
jgi:hypothetical protein